MRSGEGGRASGRRRAGIWSTQDRRLWAAMALVAIAAVAASAAGIGVRATHGAQTTADEPQYLLSALSLATNADLDIADELVAERWRAFHEVELPRQTEPLADGREVSPHDPLLPVLLAVPTRLAGWVGAKLTVSVLAGLLGAALVWTAVRRFGVAPAVAAGVVGMFILSAPLAVYGNQVYPELPAALAVTVAVAALTGPLRRAGLATLGGAVVALPWLAVKYAPVTAVLAGLGLIRLWRRGDRGHALGLAAVLTTAGVVFLAAHQAIYGGWTPYAAGDHFTGGELSVVGTEPDLAGRSRRLLGLLAGRTFGLAAWQPAWLLAVPALAAVVRSRQPGWAPLLGPLAVGWVIATFVALTMHGWWFPGRQVVVVLPCAILAVAAWADGFPHRVAAAIALGAVGVLTYAWLVIDGLAGRITWVVDFAATTNPLYQAWRLALPDYLAVTTRTWALHGLWLVLLTGVAAWSWRRAPRPTPERPVDEQHPKAAAQPG